LSGAVARIVAYTSSWADRLGNSLKNALADLMEKQQIDFGVAAKNGYFEVRYDDGDGPRVNTFKKTRALAAFIIRLLAHFQGLGTATAIDYKEYSKVLDD
jgi:hypothetical protein